MTRLSSISFNRVAPALAGLALGVGLAGCGGVSDRYGDPSSGYVGDAATRIAGADWTRAERVSLSLSEYEFAPEALVFRSGRPYSLTLVNDGESGHTFTAPEFFRAVAVRSLSSPLGVKPVPVLESIGLAAGERKTVDFVPVRPGSYELECERPLHAVFGMSGAITIE